MFPRGIPSPKMSFLLYALLVTFMVAISSGSPQYRLLDQKLTCLGVAKCPSHDESLISGSLEFSYGQKEEHLGGTFHAEYLPTGGVTFAVEALGTENHPARYSTVVLGNEPLTGNPQCEQVGVAGGSVVLSNVNFDQCGFSQRFEGQIVHRRIIVRVRHHFGVPNQQQSAVDFIGYRDIQVDFYLEPNQPLPVKLRLDPDLGEPNPDPYPVLEASVDVCAPLTHKITPVKSDFHGTWKFMVEADNYVPEEIGYGFKLESCTLIPRVVLAGGEIDFSSDTNEWTPVLLNGKLLVSAMDRPRQYVKIPGKSYEITIAQVRSASLNRAADEPPGVACDVCLCSLDPLTGDCPSSIGINFERSAFKVPESMVLPNSLLQARSVRAVPRQDLKKYSI